jgi:mycofactocin system glycosyltransferase
MMQPQQLSPGCYRLAQGTRLVVQGEQTLVLTDYPLRVLRLNGIAARLLPLCTQEQTYEQLAQALRQPVRRVATACEALRWRGLLDVGPLVSPPEWPPVSIIIPSYNRVQQLERCLHALFQQDYPAPIEIIVVDDGSQDETCSRVEQLSSAAPQGRQLRLLRHAQRRGIGNSRNSGSEAARYELLAYIDSDCVASPTWLRELVPAFQNANVVAVGGLVRAYDCTSMFGRYEDVRSSLFMGLRAQQVRPAGPLTYLPTANLLLRREIWQQLGGFAPLNLGEDVDLCRRLLSTGATILYLPQGTVYHDYRTTLLAFLRTRAAYASSEALLLQRCPETRRVLLLPPEQATFAVAAMGMFVGSVGGAGKRVLSMQKKRPFHAGNAGWPALGSLLLACLVVLFSTRKRYKALRAHQVPLPVRRVFVATLRGHLAYTYALCRHLARYYSLPLLLLGLLFPPLLFLTLLLCAIVVSVDYVRLRPRMSLTAFALCALLDDCAYAVGVVQGCVQYRMWQPLVPMVRYSNTSSRF